MATFAESLIVAARVGQQGMDFDPRAVNWVGSPNPENSQCVVRSALGITTIQQLIESPARRSELGRRARMRGQEFTADRMTDAYQHLYDQLLPAPGRSVLEVSSCAS